MKNDANYSTCSPALTALLIAIAMISLSWTGYIAFAIPMTSFFNANPGESDFSRTILAILPLSVAFGNTVVLLHAIWIFLGRHGGASTRFKFAVLSLSCALLWTACSVVIDQPMSLWVPFVAFILSIVVFIISHFQLKTFPAKRTRKKAIVGLTISLLFFLVSITLVLVAYKAMSGYVLLSSGLIDSFDQTPIAKIVHNWVAGDDPNIRLPDYLANVMFGIYQIGIVGFLGFLVTSLLMFVFVFRATKIINPNQV